MTVLASYLRTLAEVTARAEASDGGGTPLALDQAIATAIAWAVETHERGNKLIIIGNGGSAGIASHSAIDYCKNGGLRAMAFNDGAALTCLGNDYGFEHVFAKQIEFHGRAGDLLVAISSSGRSANILNAVTFARANGIRALTLSGFTADNPLRSAGELNLYLPSGEYGFVELGHQTLLHAIVDLKLGWLPAHKER
ncbi:MAG: SIS domain-containing protein [Rhodospirillaceae bacterium]|nr:SIS domain-containing protein [Rhodospirillales bacterium]